MDQINTSLADRQPAKALHTWSLFRTLGRFVAAGAMPSGDLAEAGAMPSGDLAEAESDGLRLLDLPAELARHGYRSVQLCHFYLRSSDESYLSEVRAAFDDAGVEIECLLVDDGDLTHPTAADAHQEWISGWLAVAEQLAAPRARVVAGKQAPSPSTLQASATRMRALADRHPDVRLVTENWHALLPDAASVIELLDRGKGRFGFLIDLGNWKGPRKYEDLAAVAGRAETCQAKIGMDARGALDLDDYRTSLRVLQDADYRGPLAMVYDGPDPDEWGKLDEAYAVVREVFA